MFIKHRDEKDLNRANEQPYAFQRRDGETPDGLAKRINQLYDDEKRLEPDVFTDRINVEPAILAQCVEHLEGISLDRTELDTKGVAFEEFMGGFFKGDFGQYFTPPRTDCFLRGHAGPGTRRLGAGPGLRLWWVPAVRAGPTCGARQIRRRLRAALTITDSGTTLLSITFLVWEVNDELTRVAKMNMIIHDDGHTNVVGHDALDFPEKIVAENPGLAAGRFDLVLTNPPFGAVIRRTEKGDGYLEQFELMRYLGKDYPLHTDMTGAGDETDTRLTPKSVRPRASIKTEIAFLERIHTFLKPGTGRAAVVLPDGILTNSSLQGRAALDAGTFSAAGGGEPAAVRFSALRRRGEGQYCVSAAAGRWGSCL